LSSTSKDFTTGQVLTAAQMDEMPQGVLSLVTSTSVAGPTSGTTELDVLTAAAITPAQTGRRLRLSFHARGISVTNAADTFIMRIKEGSTTLSEAHHQPAATGNTSGACDFSAFVDSPTVAAHTYKVTIVRNAGSGTASVSATATAPMTFAVEDVGAV
jgi:hypothetical protein